MRVKTAIEAELRRRFAPLQLEVIDESARHRGHAGARAEGESHFRVEIVSAAFVDHDRVSRQRLVMTALDDLLRSDIHALSIKARTPDEAARSA